MPIHLRTDPGAVADRVVLVGDPGRAQRAAEMLTEARCYNEFRGLLGYTGSWRGRRLSVQTTGMGAPSAAIVVEELADLGARLLIRAGTCGAIAPAVGVGDLVIATAACPLDGTSRTYLRGEPYAPAADFALTRALVEAAAGLPHHIGLIATEDAFYRQPEDAPALAERGVLAVEMEASVIFTLAALRGLRAGCVLLAVNDAVDKRPLTGEELHRREQILLEVAFQALGALE